MIGFVTQKDELTLAEVSFMGKEINMSSGVNSTGQTYALDMQKVSKSACSDGREWCGKINSDENAERFV